MKGHVLERRQVVPGTIDHVFAFFEDPKNLERITPPWLHFRVVSASDESVRQGTKIHYRLRLHLFPMNWRSRISEYAEDECFADEMVSGPYKRWYHRHLFNEVPGGIEMVDRVEYELPFAALGRFVHAIVVRQQLEAIFDYRATAIAQIFRQGRKGAER